MDKAIAEIVDRGYIDMKGGKEYLQVAHRIVWFRSEHSDWLIETSNKIIGERHYMSCKIMRPIFDKDGTEVGLHPVATANKEIKFEGGKGASAAYPVETAETGAIGRALGLCGYGTLSGDLDEGDQIADSPVEGATKKRK
jgi:hypothetical protein